MKQLSTFFKKPLWLLLLMIPAFSAFAQTNILSQSFDAVTFPPTGWKNQKVAGPTLPGNWNRVTAGSSPANTPHTGTGQARFNAFNYLAGTAADLVTSVLDFSTTGIYTVSFWMYRDNSAPAATDKVDVYVNTIQNSAGGAMIGTVYRNRMQSPVEASNGWFQYTFTIPASYSGTVNYIAFKATSGFGANIFIDDISIVRNVATVPACMGSGSPVSGSGGVCRNTTISWSSVLYATGYKITMGTNSPDYNNIYNNLDLGNVYSISPSLLAVSTVYNWKIVPYNIFGSTTGCSFNSFTTGTDVCYCTPEYLEGSCFSEDYIDNFSTTGGSTNISNNASGCSSDPLNNYTFFSTKTVTAAQGSSFSVSMQAGPDFAEGYGIWADWNQDGDFSDASEFVYASPTASDGIYTGTVNVPETALPGTSRFRVRCQFNLAPVASQSCETMEDGETEDYNIVITACSTTNWYADADGDTFGNPSVSLAACSQPVNYVANNADCNDASASVNPSAAEICNGLDDNCSGGADEGLTFLNYYADTDIDSYGSNIALPVNSCSAVAGSVLNNTDCNDANAAINPAASEICNGIDDNCTGGADNGLVFQNYYADTDVDGYGNAASVTNSCSVVAGSVLNNTDCNDANTLVNPGATEVCNGIDDNCTGGTDEGFTFITYYQDADADTYGNVSAALAACSGTPPGYVSNSLDCNDANAAIKPGAPEICNGADDDCDALIDEGVINTAVSAGGPTSFCTPGSVTLSAANGYTSYQWKMNGTNIAGATTRTYKAKKTANYTVTITSGTCTATSSSIAVTANKAPKATITPSGSLDLCTTGSVLLKGNNGAGYTYQWYKDGVLISGATSRNYTATSAGAYKVRVTSPAGCFKESLAANVFDSCKEGYSMMQETLRVYPNPAATSFSVSIILDTNAQLCNISLVNMIGKEVLVEIVTMEHGIVQTSISLPQNIPSGMYLVKLVADGLEYIERLVIVH